MRFLPLLVLLATLSVAAQETSPTLPLQASFRALYKDHAKQLVRQSLRLSHPLPEPTKEVVPTEDVAIQIHFAVASSVFGRENIEKQRPFFAIRSGAAWVVYGSLPISYLGGTAITVIRASNGQVLHVVHEQ